MWLTSTPNWLPADSLRIFLDIIFAITPAMLKREIGVKVGRICLDELVRSRNRKWLFEKKELKIVRLIEL